MGSLSKISILRPVTTVMLLLMVILGGILGYGGLSLAMMPTMDIPIALVSTTYIGAGPNEIETLISKPIEEALSSISNVDTVTSISSSNSSITLVQFQDGTDIDMAAIDMREKIDMIKGSLPEDANDPMVLKMDINAQPIYVGVTSDNLDLAQLNDLLEENIVNRLERIEGVSAVNLSGGDENEIQITLNPDKMDGYGLTAPQLAQALAAENLNLPSGSISQGNSKLQVRTMGEFKSLDDIKNVMISTGTGAVMPLSDIAQVEEVVKERSSYTLVNGKQGILISIDKNSTANVVEVSDLIAETLNKIEKEYPELNILMLTDTADYIKLSINNVTQTAFQSAIIAVIILFLFLRNPTTSLIIGVSIPTSILATFALMYVSDMTLNVISMGGITIGIGMLVDNSVVVMDNVFKYWDKGYSAKEAAMIGSKEIGMAVAASTLTTVAVFLPLTFAEGTIGQLFKDLSFTICFTLLSSLIVSLTFVPMACAQLLNRREKNKKERKGFITKVLDAWGRGLEKLDNFYRKVLVWVLHHKKRSMLLVIACFIGTLACAPLAGFDFMPETDEGSASISIELPKGSKLEETQNITNEVVERIKDIPEIDYYYGMVGSGMVSSGTDSSTVMISLVELEQRTRSTNEVCDEMKELLSNIAGADITISASSSAMGSFGGSDISFNITGYDSDTLRQVENEVVDLLATIPGLVDVEGSSEDVVPEARVVLDRKKASQYGITTSSLANTLNTAVSGSVATQYKVNDDEIDVRIRYDQDRMNYITDLKNITIRSNTGASIPLTEVANVEITDGALQINRENQKNYVSVSANTKDIDTSTAQKLIDEKLSSYPFPEGYEYEYGGTTEQMQEAFTKLALVLIVAIVLIYMIMASQFESLIYPTIVMFSMPLAITGGILGLLITGNTITVTSFMGFIMLVGMVVNNAIVLVDYTNQLRERGMECFDALVEAGPSRLRPILMTTLTTIIGMLPMALGTGEGTETQKSMAITIIFGMAISTIVTLILIPILYLGITNFKNKLRRKKPPKDMYNGEEQDYSKFNTSVKIPEDKVRPDTRDEKYKKEKEQKKKNKKSPVINDGGYGV